MRVASLIACIAVAPLLIGAAEPVRLQPSSPWDVDYAADSCRLIRIFGEGKSETTLVFESAEPGSMDMLVFGRPLETSETKVTARFLPVGEQVDEGDPVKTTRDSQPAILWAQVSMLPSAVTKQRKDEERAYHDRGMRPPASTLADNDELKRKRQAFADAVTEIAVDARRGHPVVLETGALGAAMNAFDQCGRDSLHDWGVDPAVEDKIVRPVWTLNPDRWMSSDDYPPDMIRRGEESQVTIRLLIDAAGKVTKCTALSHFDAPEFNKITCAGVTKRARFEPAELADGTKVPSYMTRRVIFRIAR